MLKRLDSRVLGDLVNDVGVQQTPTQLLTDANLAAALSDAAGIINSAVLVSERYTVADLAALTGDDLSLLLRLNCDLAYCLLAQRRGTDLKPPPQCQSCNDLLEAIKNGTRVFNIEGALAAGLVTRGFPSTQTFVDLNLLRDSAHRYFPVRRKQTAD